MAMELLFTRATDFKPRHILCAESLLLARKLALVAGGGTYTMGLIGGVIDACLWAAKSRATADPMHIKITERSNGPTPVRCATRGN